MEKNFKVFLTDLETNFFFMMKANIMSFSLLKNPQFACSLFPTKRATKILKCSIFVPQDCICFIVMIKQRELEHNLFSIILKTSTKSKEVKEKLNLKSCIYLVITMGGKSCSVLYLREKSFSWWQKFDFFLLLWTIILQTLSFFNGVKSGTISC